jgi:Protein of unknown function (DUF2950)
MGADSTAEEASMGAVVDSSSWLNKGDNKMRIMNHHVAPLAIVSLWIAASAFSVLAQKSAAPEFSSPAEASQSLFQAVQSNNEQAIASILGGPTELTTSTDPGQDKADRELFVQKYQEMHRLHREADGSVTLYLGAENWPFPVPLVNQNGAWHFDPVAGKKEVLFRRIGENELDAIANCRKFAAAEQHYTDAPNDPTNSSPLSLVANAASGSAAGDPVLLNGYYFRLVPVQPDKPQATPVIALIAYPAEYRSSGVMTFVVTKDDVVYEKDLGANTTTLASTMAALHKDSTWQPAGE